MASRSDLLKFEARFFFSQDNWALSRPISAYSSFNIHYSQQILKRYRDEIEWYGRVKQSHRRAYQILQVCVIVFSGITPILILMDQVPKVMQALPAALAAMFTAILATFRFQDNYVRFGYTMELLKSELFQFETRGSREYGPAVDDQKALERFIEKMESSILAEVIDWRQTALRKAEQTEQQTSTKQA